MATHEKDFPQKERLAEKISSIFEVAEEVLVLEEQAKALTAKKQLLEKQIKAIKESCGEHRKSIVDRLKEGIRKRWFLSPLKGEDREFSITLYDLDDQVTVTNQALIPKRYLVEETVYKVDKDLILADFKAKGLVPAGVLIETERAACKFNKKRS
jgi:hypothetical protein